MVVYRGPAHHTSLPVPQSRMLFPMATPARHSGVRTGKATCYGELPPLAGFASADETSRRPCSSTISGRKVPQPSPPLKEGL